MVNFGPVLCRWMEMIELGLVDGSLIDELMELTAQSLNHLEIQEHFNVVKEIGRGKYGKVLLVTHRFRGMTAISLSEKTLLGNESHVLPQNFTANFLNGTLFLTVSGEIDRYL